MIELHLTRTIFGEHDAQKHRSTEAQKHRHSRLTWVACFVGLSLSFAWSGDANPKIINLSDPVMIEPAPIDHIRDATLMCGLEPDAFGFIPQAQITISHLQAGRASDSYCTVDKTAGYCWGGSTIRNYSVQAQADFTVTCKNRVSYSGSLIWKQYKGKCNQTYAEIKGVFNSVSDFTEDALNSPFSALGYLPGEISIPGVSGNNCPEGTAVEVVSLTDPTKFDPKTGTFKFSGFGAVQRIPMELIAWGAEDRKTPLGYNERILKLPPPAKGVNTLSRPILFIHGINDQHKVWGIEEAKEKDLTTWKQGLVKAYLPGSAPDIIANSYRLQTSIDENINPQDWKINDNGIFFFNGNTKDANWGAVPIDPQWTTTAGGVGQSQQLYSKVEEILNLWYGDAWKTNMTLQIDLVAHSMGGLLVRDMLIHATAAGGTSAANPCNHIRKVVTIGTPHQGSMLSTPMELIPEDYSGLRNFKEKLNSEENKANKLFEVKIDDGFIEGLGKTFVGTCQTASDWNETVPVLGWLGGTVVGLLTGPWTDVRFKLSGGYLGDYHAKFTIDPVAAHSFVWNGDLETFAGEAGAGIQAETRKRLEDLAYSEMLARTGSPLILRLNQVAPNRPNGTPMTIVPLYSDDVSPLEEALIKNLGHAGTKACDSDSKLSKEPGCFAAEDYIESMAKKETNDWDLVDVSLDGDFFKTMAKVRDQWFKKGDIAVEAESQKYSEKVPGFIYDIKTPREFKIHRSYRSSSIEKMVVHGGIPDMDGIPIAREAEMGNDIFCALDEYCSANIVNGDPIRLIDQVLAMAMSLPDANGVAQSTTVQTATVTVQGNFDVSTTSVPSGDAQGVVVLDANNQMVATVGANVAGSLFNGSTIFGSFGRVPSFRMVRSGNILTITAISQDGQTLAQSFTVSTAGNLKIGSFTTGVSSQIPMLVASQIQLVNPAKQQPPAQIPDSRTAEDSGVLVMHRESRGLETNVSKPRILLVNREEQAIHGFKLYYYFTADPARNPVAVADWAPSQSVTTEALGGDQFRMVVDGSNVTLQPHLMFPANDGDQFRIFYQKDNSSWYLWDDWSENHNYGLPKANDKIVVTDLTGRVLWGHAPDLTVATQPSTVAPKVALQSKDQGIHEGNVSKPEVQVTNTGSVPIKNFHVEYYFRIDAGKVMAPPEKWPAVEQATPTVRHIGGSLWVLDWYFNQYSLYPGESINSGMVGLHYNPYSDWNKSDDPSYMANGDWARNANLVLRLEDGSILQGQVPEIGDIGEVTPPEPPIPTAPSNADLEVRMRDESDWVNLKPRFTVTNNSAVAVSGFNLGFDYRTENGFVPVLVQPLWWAPGCQGQNAQVSADLWRVTLICTSLDVKPGQSWPDQTGATFGVHDTNWSHWLVSNDPCMVGITGSMSKAQVQVSNVQAR